MNNQETNHMDIADGDLFECVKCREVLDIEDSIATDDGLSCPACSHVEAA